MDRTTLLLDVQRIENAEVSILLSAAVLDTNVDLFYDCNHNYQKPVNIYVWSVYILKYFYDTYLGLVFHANVMVHARRKISWGVSA